MEDTIYTMLVANNLDQMIAVRVCTWCEDWLYLYVTAGKVLDRPPAVDY